MGNGQWRDDAGYFILFKAYFLQEIKFNVQFSFTSLD
jgi:hypothetical protein